MDQKQLIDFLTKHFTKVREVVKSPFMRLPKSFFPVSPFHAWNQDTYTKFREYVQFMVLDRQYRRYSGLKVGEGTCSKVEQEFDKNLMDLIKAMQWDKEEDFAKYDSKAEQEFKAKALECIEASNVSQGEPSGARVVASGLSGELSVQMQPQYNEETQSDDEDTRGQEDEGIDKSLLVTGVVAVTIGIILVIVAIRLLCRA